MASKPQEDTRRFSYLLGEISEAEREQLEGAYFADDDAFELMLSTEDDLIDSYVRGQLSVEERQRFEKLYLATPRERERVLFSRALTTAVSGMRPTETASKAGRSPWLALFAPLHARHMALRFALAASALAVVISLSWLLIEHVKMRDELGRLRDERAALVVRVQEMEQRAAAEQSRSKELLAQLEGERAQPPVERGQQADDSAAGQDRQPPAKGGRQMTRPSIISFVLTPGIVRGSGAITLAVPRGASAIALRLNSETGTYVSYRAVIERVDGSQVWRADSIKLRQPARMGGTIDLPALPAKDLPPDDYVLRLSGERPDGGFEGVADYSFRVVKK